ncbi:MAG: hypothetical protein HGA90_01810 [Alphaproteobacteria bacterium]|nr:hypothetical protein [Alphaproteobacteria bacterium]
MEQIEILFKECTQNNEGKGDEAIIAALLEKVGCKNGLVHEEKLTHVITSFHPIGSKVDSSVHVPGVLTWVTYLDECGKKRECCETLKGFGRRDWAVENYLSYLKNPEEFWLGGFKETSDETRKYTLLKAGLIFKAQSSAKGIGFVVQCEPHALCPDTQKTVRDAFPCTAG